MQLALRKWVTKSQERFKPSDCATAGAGKRVSSLKSSFEEGGLKFSPLRGATVTFCSSDCIYVIQSCFLCRRGLSACSAPPKNSKLALERL